MGCDYYKSCCLIILFKDGKKYVTGLDSERGYFPDYESDSDCEFNSVEYLDKLKRLNPDKILYENGKWIKIDYKSKYESYIIEFPPESVDSVYKEYNFRKL